jgi:transposase, IS5 family
VCAHFLNVAEQMLPRRRSLKAAVRRQLSYVTRNLEAIDAQIVAGASLLARKPHWWQKLLSCSELHQQQSILLTSKTNSIPDCLVNLVQTHVRPIVRGKDRAAVEFGALARRASACGRSAYPFRMAFPSCIASTGIPTTKEKT